MKINWTAVGAVGTLAAVLVAIFVAIFLPSIREFCNRPILEMSPRSYGFLRWSHEPNSNPTVGIGALEIELKNTGNSSRNDVSPFYQP